MYNAYTGVCICICFLNKLNAVFWSYFVKSANNFPSLEVTTSTFIYIEFVSPTESLYESWCTAKEGHRKVKSFKKRQLPLSFFFFLSSQQRKTTCWMWWGVLKYRLCTFNLWEPFQGITFHAFGAPPEPDAEVTNSCLRQQSCSCREQKGRGTFTLHLAAATALPLLLHDCSYSPTRENQVVHGIKMSNFLANCIPILTSWVKRD